MSNVPATQSFIEVEKIQQDTLILRSGGLRKILIVTGINFDLKSEEEQGLIIYSFQNFLNALNFPVQLFVHSRKLNIDSYLNRLSARQQEEPVELLKNIIGEYQDFIRSFVGQNAIMQKTFFVVVPYDPVDITAVGKGISTSIKRLFGKKENLQLGAEEAQQKFDQHREQINQRVDQVTASLAQIGLRAVPLNDGELTELFYNLYNPESVEKKLWAISKT